MHGAVESGRKLAHLRPHHAACLPPQYPCPMIEPAKQILPMKQAFAELLNTHPKELRGLVYHYLNLPKKLFLRSDVIDEFDRFCDTDEGSALRGTVVARAIRSIQEGVVNEGTVYFAVRLFSFREKQRTRSYWIAFFGCFALSSLLAGTVHGFSSQLSSFFLFIF